MISVAMGKGEKMDDLISRTWLLAEYDKRHKGPPGGARKLIEEAPSALGTNLAEVGTDVPDNNLGS